MITVEFYENRNADLDDAQGWWRWRIRAANGRILADSGEGYARRIDAVRGCELVIGRTVDAPARGAFSFTVSR